MKKQLLGIGFLIYTAMFSAVAVGLNEWSFENDVAGLTLSQSTNSGSEQAVFESGGAGFLETDGSGSLLCTHNGSGTTGAWVDGVVLDADVADATSGIQYLRCDFNYDLSDLTHEGSAVLGLSFVGSTGTNFIGLSFVSDLESAAVPADVESHPVVTNLYSSGEISAIIKVDVNTRILDVWYDLTGENDFDESSPAVSGIAVNVNDIDTLRFQATGDFRPAGSSDYAAVDHLRTASTWADIVLPPRFALTTSPLFSHHMVLQRDRAVSIWGEANPGETVTVKLDGNPIDSVLTDDRGQWIAEISAHAADGGMAHEITVTSPGHPDVQIVDVVFGDVYLASGQSNMGITMSYPGISGYAAEQAAADEYSLIRQVAIAKTSSAAELNEPALASSWTNCNSASIENFSATGYFFAKHLYQETGVPVGLLFCAWGGQSIERFLSPSGLAAVPELAGMRQYQEQGGITNLYDIYNAMIAPLIPYGVRGAIWYQGENNGNDGPVYSLKMRALMRGWRQGWAQGDFPFYYVQLANYETVAEWAELRNAQLTALSETNCGMAVAIDIGEDFNIHPGNKADLGDRLARWALAKEFKQDVAFSGPLYRRSLVEGSQIRLLFDYATNGLMAGRKDGTNAVVAVDGPVDHFEIAGVDKSFVSAQAVIDRDTVLVSSPNVGDPAYVRYGYANVLSGSNTLYNTEGLPASPFRTDGYCRLHLKFGGGASAHQVPGAQIVVSATAPAAGKVFDRWIGAAAEIENPNAASTTVTMPEHVLYLLATYRDVSEPTYALSVSNGYGSGSSQAGSIVNIAAFPAESGQCFETWAGDTQSVTDVSAAVTTLRMPADDVELTAVYRIVDSVGDGIADRWRALYFDGDGTFTNDLSCRDADPDEDGLTNWQEYRAGTLPDDAASILQLGGEVLGKNLSLNFMSAAGRRYRMETTASLVTPVWQTVLYNITGDGFQKHTQLDIEAETGGFYRLCMIAE